MLRIFTSTLKPSPLTPFPFHILSPWPKSAVINITKSLCSELLSKNSQRFFGHLISQQTFLFSLFIPDPRPRCLSRNQPKVLPLHLLVAFTPLFCCTPPSQGHFGPRTSTLVVLFVFQFSRQPLDSPNALLPIPR
jgi:hypothetical protein